MRYEDWCVPHIHLAFRLAYTSPFQYFFFGSYKAQLLICIREKRRVIDFPVVCKEEAKDERMNKREKRIKEKRGNEGRKEQAPRAKGKKRFASEICLL